MTAPEDRPRTDPEKEPACPALYTREAALELARRVMMCETCEWAVKPIGDECAETQFVRGCIHWKART